MPELLRSAAEGRKLPSGLQNSSTGSQGIRQDGVCMRGWAGVHEAEQGIDLSPGTIMGRDAVSLGQVARMMSFPLLGSVTSPPEGQGLQAGGWAAKNPVEQAGFHGHSLCHRTPRSTLGWAGRSRLWFEALPRSKQDQPWDWGQGCQQCTEP